VDVNFLVFGDEDEDGFGLDFSRVLVPRAEEEEDVVGMVIMTGSGDAIDGDLDRCVVLECKTYWMLCYEEMRWEMRRGEEMR